MKIEDEEYEIVGYIKKVCVCEKCMQIMNKGSFIPMDNGEQYTYKYEMICPKCGKKELVDSELLSDQFKLVKKVEE